MNKLQIVAVAFAAVMLDAAAAGWGKAPNGVFWNWNSRRFVYAPVLGFEKVEGAVKYVNEVIDDFHGFNTIESAAPEAELESLWEKLPVGYVTVICRGVDGEGRVLGEAGRRTFWKKAAFRPGSYEPAAMAYGLARTRVIDCFVRMPHIVRLRETGEPDRRLYPLNGYPSKMLASEVTELSAFAKNGTFDKNDAGDLMALARKAADALIAYSVPAGQALEYLPRTYHEEGSEYGRFKGEQDRIHMLYPAKGGVALVNIYNATGDRKYLEAAERIARTYIRHQGKNGTWSMLLNAKTGEASYDNKNLLVPMDVIFFMEKLYAATKNEAYRRCADEAFRFMDEGPMHDWNWEGQFEDGSNQKVTTHKNLSNFPANMMAQYLVERFPGDAKRLAQAEELVKFVEDQFIDWEPPYDHGRSNAEYGKSDDGSWSWFCRPTSKWCCPVVMEQYGCYVPVDASAAKTINTLVSVWKASGKARYLKMAQALADAQTRMIESDGFINTWGVKGVKRNDHRHHTWDNCTMEIMTALGTLDAAMRK